MGKELEYKLQITEKTEIDTLLADSVFQGHWQEKAMKTTYFDSRDGRFSKSFWTFRHRLEGEESIVCVKTPTEDRHTRGEWQISAEQIDDSAIEKLVQAGAPMQLAVLYGVGDIIPVCGAAFVRKSMMLTFCDGSKAEFAYDRGELCGKTQRVPLHEVELELYEGSPTEMLKLVEHLKATYQLEEEPLSKHARARQLN